MIKEIAWHNLSWREVFKKLDSNYKKGLSEKEAVLRQKKFGKNLLPKKKGLSGFRIFLDQLKSPLIYILIIAGIIVLFFKEWSDAIVIFGAVFLNTIVGFFQERKANDALEKLKKVVKIKTHIIREGRDKIIDSENVVPGDIVVLTAGDRVPADGRIVECYDFKTNEMALTGEWVPAQKKSKILPEDTPLGDRDNMVYMGTLVESGKAKIVVTSIGEKTEMGKIARMVKEAKEEKTPLQKKLSRFSKFIGISIVILSLIIFFEGIITGNNFLEMFTVSVAVAVAAIPEGLPVAMTIILAFGMQRILKKGGLVRKLSSAETLGSTSVIATDKTGTLTEGKMKVVDVVTERKKDKKFALEIATIANEAFIENPDDSMERWIVRGRPTDKALLLAGIEAGIDKKKLEKEKKTITELPFDSKRKFLAKAVEEKRGRDVIYFAGAPEKILEMSSYQKGGEVRTLTNRKKKEIEREIKNLTRKGLRLVAVAYKRINNLKDVFNDLVFVGMIVLKDPIRKEVKEAIKICSLAGMRPIIVTGDHKLTALAVAQEIGMKVSEKNIIEGKDLDKISDKEFNKILKDIKIFARVEPKHKMRIIQAWQDRGEVIAMTGDGINDAPALKKADIGVALGDGTEIAKEVSDLILLTNNFNIIVKAVEEGRVIIDNIRKVITYLLSDSFTETILIGVSILAGFPLPVTAVQILWVNLIADGLPNISLAFDPKEKDIMKQKVQGHKVPLLTREMKVIIFIVGLITDLILLGLFFWIWNRTHDVAYTRTMTFACLTIDSLFYIFSCRSLRRNVWNINPFSNKLLIGGVVFGFLMLFMAIYVPFLQILLKTIPLSFSDWFLVFGLGVLEMFLIEMTKFYFIARHQTNV